MIVTMRHPGFTITNENQACSQSRPSMPYQLDSIKLPPLSFDIHLNNLKYINSPQ